MMMITYDYIVFCDGMKIIVTDACSLILLAKSDLIETLAAKDTIIISDIVYNEAIESGIRIGYPDARILKDLIDKKKIKGTSLVITGGLRISSDFAKALALGADAVAIGTAALIAIGCKQYRVCHTGKCPTGITTHDPALRSKLDIEASASRLKNYLDVITKELKDFARLTGNHDVHALRIRDLCTTNSEISDHTDIEHV